MKRARATFTSTISQLVPVATIGVASAAKADDGLPHPGFEVMVVSDATAAAQLPGLDGYAAEMTNFRMIASDVTDTATVTAAILAAAQ